MRPKTKLILSDKEQTISELTALVTGSAYRPGNQLTIMRNGDEIFPAMLEAIRTAHHSIVMCTYVYWRGNIAWQFAEALAERAQAGVQVRILLDAIGAAKIESELVEKMKAAGVNFAWFRPLHWYNLRRINNRTHRKILVIDGHVGFTGGVGIAEEWTGNAQDVHHWRDTHCRIEGPAATELVAGFCDNWYEATGEIITTIPVDNTRAGHVDVLTTLSEASKGASAAERLFLAATQSAHKRLWITSAYFVPSDIHCQHLIDAASRGVDVRILTNGSKTNHKITRRAGQSFYHKLLKGGVRIYEYQPTVLHTKSLTADSTWSTLGSVNFDMRSLILNDEISVSFDDRGVAEELERHFNEDLRVSREIHLHDWNTRGALRRSFQFGASLFKKQL